MLARLNMRDMVSKGRSNKLHGEEHGRAVLTAVEVSEIRTLYKAHQRWDKDTTQEALARRFGVSVSNIRFIITGATWRDDSYSH
jgi:hypothetical protein